ncbi:MAG TPA: DUF5335 family protein [Pyrinomonadaceae bacterium]|nr:DUF5335 family protein [Pyrinomonadaceae bacterium]
MAGFIEQDRWQSFLDDFSKRNQLRATRLEVVDSEAGAGEEEEFLPLVGVSFEKKGSDAGSIVVILGDKNDRHVEHRIENVQRIAPLVGEDTGLEAGLGFEDEDGSRTLLLLEEFAELPENAASASRG